MSRAFFSKRRLHLEMESRCQRCAPEKGCISQCSDCQKRDRHEILSHMRSSLPSLFQSVSDTDFNMLSQQLEQLSTSSCFSEHHGPTPAAATVQEGSRVRITGLQAKPQHNGRTGVVCGAFDQESGRWSVEVDASDAGPAFHISIRPDRKSVV